jgi:hypothetical protein
MTDTDQYVRVIAHLDQDATAVHTGSEYSINAQVKVARRVKDSDETLHFKCGERPEDVRELLNLLKKGKQLELVAAQKEDGLMAKYVRVDRIDFELDKNPDKDDLVLLPPKVKAPVPSRPRRVGVRKKRTTKKARKRTTKKARKLT